MRMRSGEAEGTSRISIIIPVLNQEQFIADCLQSIYAQDYREFEVIVKDGGSNDRTLAMAERFPVRIVSSPDKGIADAINQGFALASGDFVGWLNGDDYLMPGALSALVAHAISTPRSDLIYGDSVFVDNRGRLLRLKAEHHFDFATLLFRGCYIPSSGGSFFHRSILEGNHFLDDSYKVAMDYEYFVRLARMEKRFSYLPRPLAAFRWHGGNTSLIDEARFTDSMRIRTGVSDKGPSQLRVLSVALKFKRAIMKTAEGSIRREVAAYRLRGHDTRWFSTREGLITANRLLALSRCKAG